MNSRTALLVPCWCVLVILLCLSPHCAAQALINVNLGPGVRVGTAAVGNGVNDYWNAYHPTNEVGQLFDPSSLVPLFTVDYTNAAAGMLVCNVATNGANSVGDAMFDSWLAASGTNLYITLTNLPYGAYDVYVYGHGNSDELNSIVSLQAAWSSYGTTNTATNTAWNTNTWVEGAQYVVFRNVFVPAGQNLQLTIGTNASGLAILNGFQLHGKTLAPTQDSDGDGLSDTDELQRGTNPFSADTDGDGFTDAVEVAADTNPLSSGSRPPVRLGHWKFDTSTTWAGEVGQLPLEQAGALVWPSWSSNAVRLFSATNEPARLLYRDQETNGQFNVSGTNGAIRFWFNPGWASGTGSSQRRLVEFGAASDGTNHGAWTLYVDAGGTNLVLATGNTELLRVPVNWAAGRWQQVVVNYTTTNSAVYLNGQLLGTGAGVPPGMDTAGRLSIGSDGSLGQWSEPVWVAASTNAVREYVPDLSEWRFGQWTGHWVEGEGSGAYQREVYDWDWNLLYSGYGHWTNGQWQDFTNASVGVEYVEASSQYELGSWQGIWVEDPTFSHPEGLWRTVYDVDWNATYSRFGFWFRGWDGRNGSAEGSFDELETFDAPLNGNRISQAYSAALNAMDSDGDGLTDAQELIRGTDRYAFDTDGDGVPDGIEVAEATDPLDANSYVGRRIGYWRWNIATNWAGESGQLPVLEANVNSATSWSGIGPSLSSSPGQAARLVYRAVEADGKVNASGRRGTVRFWYRPEAAADGQIRRLVEFGTPSQGTNHGSWTLYVDGTGTNLVLASGSSELVRVAAGLGVPRWTQVTVTYSATNTAIYVNGLLAGTGAGVPASAQAEVVAQNRLSLGSNGGEGRWQEPTWIEVGDGVDFWETMPAGGLLWGHWVGQWVEDSELTNTNSFLRTVYDAGGTLVYEGTGHWLNPSWVGGETNGWEATPDGSLMRYGRWVGEWIEDPSVMHPDTYLRTHYDSSWNVLYSGYGYWKRGFDGANDSARGTFDELETFNYPLETDAIMGNYQWALGQMDSDGDGLSDAAELSLGTNRYLGDTDDDGIPDAQEVADGTNPLDALSFLERRLAYWRFDNTNAFMGEAGQLPTAAENAVAASSWSGAAGRVSSFASEGARLVYRSVETNGMANVTARRGTIRFWYRPEAAADGQIRRLVEFGTPSQGTNHGSWTLYVDGTGTNLVLASGSSELVRVAAGLGVPRWTQVTVTYSATNTAIYVNGLLAGTGAGVPAGMSTGGRLSLGSDGSLGDWMEPTWGEASDRWENDPETGDMRFGRWAGTWVESDGPGAYQRQAYDWNWNETYSGYGYWQNGNWLPPADTEGGEYDSVGGQWRYGHWAGQWVEDPEGSHPDSYWRTVYDWAWNERYSGNGHWARGWDGQNHSARGSLDEVETFNHPLQSTAIFENYLAALGQMDSDGDGLNDATEAGLGTNPHVADTDGDGIADGQELSDRTNPLDPDNFVERRLGFWRFNNTNTWVGEAGQLPLVATNLVAGASWEGTAATLNGPANGAVRLVYRDAEANGAANVTVRRGTVRFWYRPEAAADGQIRRLVEFGTPSQGTNHGSWTLYVDGTGTNLVLASGITESLRVPVNLTLDRWVQVTATYSATNSAIYLNGVIAGTGAGVPAGLGAEGRLSVGSNGGEGNWADPLWVDDPTQSTDPSGYWAFVPTLEEWRFGHFEGGVWQEDADFTQQDSYWVLVNGTWLYGKWVAGFDGSNQPAQGSFEELETFNYPLTPQQLTQGNSPPSVSWMTPTNGAAFAEHSNMPLEAAASGGTGPIAEVMFYAGTNIIGSVSNAPFQLTWVDVAAGQYELKAAARNAIGLCSTSTVSVIVAAPPTVALLTPTNEAVYFTPAVVSLTATASQTNLAITEVSFFAGANLLASMSQPPYAHTWTNPPVGSHEITAVARNQYGIAATSEVATITVERIPQVTLSSPTNGIVLFVPGTVTIAGGVDGFGALITNVSIYVNSALATSFDYNFVQNPGFTYDLPVTNSNDPYLDIYATTMDEFGVTSSSRVVRVVVNPPPTVEITAPTDGVRVNRLEPQLLSASASDDGEVVSVKFYARLGAAPEATLLGTLTNGNAGQYDLTWTNLLSGVYQIYAVATDNNGVSNISTAINLTANEFPAIEISRPSADAVYVNVSSVELKVSARDVDGSIASVDYYEGGELLGTVTNAPFSLVWTNVSFGTHTITAVATDNLGDTTTSAAVTFTTLEDSDGDGVPDIMDVNPTEFDAQRLGYWKFDNTNNWTGEQGQLPVIATNLAGASAWSSNAVQMQSRESMPARLLYRPVETNGAANFAAGQGTIRFWFQPNWSTSWGALPDHARLLELGAKSVGTNCGSWTLYVDRTAQSLILASGTNELLRVPINWEAADWKHIAVTYSRTNTTIYINGQLSGTGPGLTEGVDLTELVSIGSNGGEGKWSEPVWVPYIIGPFGFPVGGGYLTGGIWVDDPQNLSGKAHLEFINGAYRLGYRSAAFDGRNQSANGQFDELETFNHPLSASAIATNLFAPAITLITPHSGGTALPEWASLPMEAAATATVGGVAEVRFLINSNLAQSLTAPPYKASSYALPTGQYAVQAVVKDTRGVTIASPVVNVTVSPPPVVTLQSPLDGTIFMLPTNIFMEAVAAQSIGAITNVGFYCGTNLLAERTNAPYTFLWTNAPVGSLDLIAVAANEWGLMATSRVAHVRASAPPTVALHTPTNQSRVNLPGVLSVSASATADVNIAYFFVYADGVVLAGGPPSQSGTNATYSAAIPLATKWRVIWVVAVNDLGVIGRSSPSFLNQIVLQPPQVTLVYPTNNSRLPSSAAVQVSASATDADGAVSQVVFHAKNVQSGIVTTIGATSASVGGVYSVTWAQPTAGNYQFYAVATDTDGLTGQTAKVSALLNNPPSITITSPAVSSSFTQGANVSFSVNASDFDGSVAKVDYFEGGVLLASVTNAPFGWTWSNAPVASHTITAKATDNLGAVTSSASTTLTLLRDTDRDGIPDASDAAPLDYYNGLLPSVTVMGGGGQTNRPGQLAPEPLLLKVTDSMGQPLANAPLRFQSDSSSLRLALVPGGPWHQFIDVFTGTDGTAVVYARLPQRSSGTYTVSATAASGISSVSQLFSLSTTAGSTDRVRSVQSSPSTDFIIMEDGTLGAMNSFSATDPSPIKWVPFSGVARYAAGDFKTVCVVDEVGDVFLGVGDNLASLQFTRVTLPSPAVSLSGFGPFWVVMANGSVASFLTPESVSTTTLPLKIKAIDVAWGFPHSILAVLEDGRAICFGGVFFMNVWFPEPLVSWSDPWRVMGPEWGGGDVKFAGSILYGYVYYMLKSDGSLWVGGAGIPKEYAGGAQHPPGGWLWPRKIRENVTGLSRSWSSVQITLASGEVEEWGRTTILNANGAVDSLYSSGHLVSFPTAIKSTSTVDWDANRTLALTHDGALYLLGHYSRDPLNGTFQPHMLVGGSALGAPQFDRYTPLRDSVP